MVMGISTPWSSSGTVVSCLSLAGPAAVDAMVGDQLEGGKWYLGPAIFQAASRLVEYL